MACVSMGAWSCRRIRSPPASLPFLTGPSIRSVSVRSMTMATSTQNRHGLLYCSFVPTTSFDHSSFSGSSMGLKLNSNIGMRREKNRSLVVRAVKYQSWQTKRNRSGKSLSRVHGFRKRMTTTSGRAVLKRRRAKGRWVLCTKSHPNSGKAS